MDIKSILRTLTGVLLIGAALWMTFIDTSRQQQAQESAAKAAQNTLPEAPKAEAETPAPLPEIFKDPSDAVTKQSVTLVNDFIRAVFTNRGGAIERVDLLKYKKDQESNAPYSFNDANGRFALALAFPSDLPNTPPVVFEKLFETSQDGDTRVNFVYHVPAQIRIIKTFAISKTATDTYEPYTIAATVKVENLSGKPLDFKTIYLTLGVAEPNEGDINGTNLAFTLYNGTKAYFLHSTEFVPSNGVLGFGKRVAKPFNILETSPATWGAVKNQFFAAIFTPLNKAGEGGWALPVLLRSDDENAYMQKGLEGMMGFAFDELAPAQIWEIKGAFYVGPKELKRLSALGGGQDEVMNFGWFGFVSKPMLWLLNFVHGYVSKLSPEWAWGWSIVILTIIVRIILLPLSAIQIRSSKRMSKLAKPIAEIKEKFKGDQQKIGQETMKLYGQYGINPMAGCLPVLIQFPVFIGLYYMLQTSSEIRFAHFFWITDLSLPDKIAALPVILGFPLHILPIINTGLTFIQFHMTPMPSQDKSQKMIMSFLPVMMLVFFYSFPSGVVLYWTVQSTLGILQTLYILKTKDKFVLVEKKRKPGFMSKIHAAIEIQQKLKAQGFSDEEIKKKIAKMAEDEKAAARAAKLGQIEEKNKKNPGGRSTPPKRKN